MAKGCTIQIRAMVVHLFDLGDHFGQLFPCRQSSFAGSVFGAGATGSPALAGRLDDRGRLADPFPTVES